MRTLPSLVTTAKDKTFTRPVTLVEINLKAHKANPALTLRLCDRRGPGGADYSAAGDTWKPLLISLSRTADQVRPGAGMTGVDSSIRIELINIASDAFSPAARLSTVFQNYKPEAGSVKVWQWFEGEGFGAGELAEDFEGVIAAPVNYGPATLSFDILSYANDFGKRHILKPFTLADFPDLPAASAGKPMPVPIGRVLKAPLFAVTDSAETVLASLADVGDTVLNVADTSKFPNSGIVSINNNSINYTGKTATTFTGVTGILEVHYDGAPVTEQIAEWRYLFADPRFPISAVNKLYGGAKKHLIDPADYTVDLAAGLVRFPNRPKVVLHDNTILRSLFLDQVDPSNTALNAANAFDFNETDKVATISQANPTLALKQIDSIQDLGPISRVWVQVFHFADANLVNDSVDVQIDGVGSVGTLANPAPTDKASVSSLVDIDHPTFHTLAQTISPNLPAHNNTTDAEKTETQGATSGAGEFINLTAGLSTNTILFPAAPGGATGADYEIGVRIVSGIFGIGVTEIKVAGHVVAKYNTSRGQWDYTPLFTINGGQGTSYTMSITAGNFNIDVTVARRDVRYTGAPSAAHTAVQNSLGSGSITDTTGNKTPANTTLKASNVADNRIEITSTVLAGGGWSWFLNKTLKLVYTGSSDGRQVFVIGAHFEVEYARQRVEFVDDTITGDLDGIVDDAQGTITGTPSAVIERPDHVFRWSLDVGLGVKRPGYLELPAGGFLEMADGTPFELPSGDETYTDLASLNAAGTKYAAAGYLFAGVMLEDKQTREYWRSWARQCRSIFYANRGRLFSLFYRPTNGETESTTTVKEIADTAMIMADKISSLRITRTPQDEIINTIDLKYAPDYLGGGFEGVASASDQTSIDRYGTRTDPARFEFDFVNLDAMASDLVTFYLAENKEPFKVATFLAHLNQLELELFDIIGVQAELIDGAGGSAKPGLILGVGRQYGSGRRRIPNTFKMAVRLVNTGKLSTGGFGVQKFGTTGFGGKSTLD